MRTLPTVLISILISNLHQAHCQDSDTSIYFEKSSEFNLVSSQEVNITSTVNPRDQSNSALQECFPFCAEFQGTPPSVSEWEASRYEKRLGNLKYVDPIIGSAGKDPKVYDPEYSGLIPAPSPPFAAVRFTAMTRQNFVSSQPYYYYDDSYHGAIGSRQPAVWMGDYGFSEISTGLGKVRANFTERGLPFDHSPSAEFVSAYKHSVLLDSSDFSKDSKIYVQLTGTSHVGYLSYDFHQPNNDVEEEGPSIVLQATRSGWRGAVFIDPGAREISGWNPQRFDYKLGPQQAPSFKGYFVARFDKEFQSYGTTVGNDTGTTIHENEKARWNEEQLSGFARFEKGTKKLQVRIGMSLISVEQARRNLDTEIPDGIQFEEVVRGNIDVWKEKVDRVQIEGARLNEMRILYTGMYHSLQFPSEHSEPGPKGEIYYSAYDDSVHHSKGKQYQGYSIWDTWRAQWAFLILFAPERITDMVNTMLDIYQQSGRLPMWANLAETNIMLGTHSNGLIAEALIKGVKGISKSLAWEAVQKDAEVPPHRDLELQFADREEYTPMEVRAGLTLQKKLGYVAHESTAESATRTLEHCVNDATVAVVAEMTGHEDKAEIYRKRSKMYVNVFNNETGFMAPRFGNGSFLDVPLEGPLAREDGFTEGNRWPYTFYVPQDVPGLATLLGGEKAMGLKLDQHFAEGHNDQSNEPSHHIPYLYSMIGQPSKTQFQVRQIAQTSYSDSPDGYSGNEDCGQQSAWNFFSSMGLYPVMPVDLEMIVGSPFFERMEIEFPEKDKLVISAKGAQSMNYVKGVKVNGERMEKPMIKYEDLIKGGRIEFEMSEVAVDWE